MYLLVICNRFLPQIFKGASNSRRIGWDRNISLDLMQRPRISFSDSWTFLPGRAPRTCKQNNNVNHTLIIVSRNNYWHVNIWIELLGVCANTSRPHSAQSSFHKMLQSRRIDVQESLHTNSDSFKDQIHNTPKLAGWVEDDWLFKSSYLSFVFR